MMSLITISGSDDRTAHWKPRHAPPRSGIARGLVQRLGVCPSTHYQFGNVFRGQCLNMVKSLDKRIPMIAENIRRDILFPPPLPLYKYQTSRRSYTLPPVLDARRPNARDPDVVVALE
ncbi:hypothetical protein F511_13127 [Dorcoceras hygrometricum]|uniref:Uncharacterized protein n=1 Tax=Dorcoceras hygrometricum TaxID=472368 RepID=A0A2Z7CZK9_9LAMI|nr:hypothetical protein F511_13127 [Dorcoceras hygrometricum]